MAVAKKLALCAAIMSSIHSSAAFAPQGAGRLGLWDVPKLKASAPAVRSGRRVSNTKMDMGLVNTVVGFPLMYALMSANEYVTHRYYQHNEVGKIEICQTPRNGLALRMQHSLDAAFASLGASTLNKCARCKLRPGDRAFSNSNLCAQDMLQVPNAVQGRNRFGHLLCTQIGKLELYQTLRKMNKIPKLDGGGHVEHHVSIPFSSVG